LVPPHVLVLAGGHDGVLIDVREATAMRGPLRSSGVVLAGTVISGSSISRGRTIVGVSRRLAASRGVRECPRTGRDLSAI
jgi:hypothetical protein